MNAINRQTVAAALIGMAAALLCVLGVKTYGWTGEAKARFVSETRVVQATEVPASGAPAHACPDMTPPDMGSAAGRPATLAWQAPDGWADAGSKGLRMADFRVGASGEAGCYVTVLAGPGGGVAMNVNRWRAQLGLPEATEEEISALPKVSMLGGEAVLVDIEGTYGGMTGDVHTGAEPREAYRLLGAISQRPNDAVFVKMTGPAAVVAAERDNFLAFAKSIRDAVGPIAAAGARECCELEQ